MKSTAWNLQPETWNLKLETFRAETGIPGRGQRYRELGKKATTTPLHAFIPNGSAAFHGGEEEGWRHPHGINT
jgi:hypothetical protein